MGIESGADGNRTRTNSVDNRVLCRLSYSTVSRPGRTRTSAPPLSGERSASELQVAYRPASNLLITYPRKCPCNLIPRKDPHTLATVPQLISRARQTNRFESRPMLAFKKNPLLTCQRSRRRGARALIEQAAGPRFERGAPGLQPGALPPKRTSVNPFMAAVGLEPTRSCM